MMKKIALTIAMGFSSQGLFAEEIREGGKLLKKLIEDCQIVGLASDNVNARYALRNFRSVKILGVKGNSILIENLQLESFSDKRPRYLVLNLTEIRTTEAGEEYKISGSFTNLPDLKPGSLNKRPYTLALGTLDPFWFNPNQKIQMDGIGQYQYRGKMRYIAHDLIEGPLGVSVTSGRELGWDLTVAEDQDQEGICASGQDIFIK